MSERDIYPECSCLNCAVCFLRLLDERERAHQLPPGFAALLAFARDMPRHAMKPAIAGAWSIIEAVREAERERLALCVERIAEHIENDAGGTIARGLLTDDGLLSYLITCQRVAAWLRAGGEG